MNEAREEDSLLAVLISYLALLSKERRATKRASPNKEWLTYPSLIDSKCVTCGLDAILPREYKRYIHAKWVPNSIHVLDLLRLVENVLTLSYLKRDNEWRIQPKDRWAIVQVEPFWWALSMKCRSSLHRHTHTILLYLCVIAQLLQVTLSWVMALFA